MKTKSPSNEYVLFFRDTQLAKRLSPEEMQALTLEWAAWVGRLRKQRKIKDGGPLEHEGTFISRKNAGLASNIPLIASQERSPPICELKPMISPKPWKLPRIVRFSKVVQPSKFDQ